MPAMSSCEGSTTTVRLFSRSGCGNGRPPDRSFVAPVQHRMLSPLPMPPPMLRTVEAIVESDGSLRLLEDVELKAGDRALVTVLREEEAPADARLSEAALAEDWQRDEEDEAWDHLQA